MEIPKTEKHRMANGIFVKPIADQSPVPTLKTLNKITLRKLL